MYSQRILVWIVLAATNVVHSPAVFSQHETTITRVFWQDQETQKLSYADVTTTSKWNLKRGWVTGFPQLDAASQSLGEMQQAGSVLMLGIDANGGVGGWLAIDSGVFEEPHGSHSHWRYSKPPLLKQSALQSGEGKNAAVYSYDNHLFLTDAGKSGFTKAIPNNLKFGTNNAHRFFVGGGGEKIALAAINNAVAYAAHSDTEGDNAGRIDVVNLLKVSDQLAYSFKLNVGGVSAATVNSGKVFFAHAGGVSWVTADTSASKAAETIQPIVLSNSDDKSDNSVIGGEFANQRNWVLYSTGSGASSAVCLVNAAMQTPTAVRLPIPTEDGLTLTAPSVVLSLGKRYAFVFQERTDVASQAQEKLTIIELDPNKDRQFSDAKLKLTIPVGASKQGNRGGQHGICFDAFGRYAIFTEPADGVVSVMSLQNMSIVARFQVGGVPDRIIAVGAAEHHH